MIASLATKADVPALPTRDFSTVDDMSHSGVHEGHVMRRLIGPIIGLLTAVTAANAQNMMVHELPDVGAGRVDMRSVEAQLDAAGWFGVERNYMRALLTDLAAANVTGTLKPGTGIALKFSVKRDKTTPAMATEVHQYEFTL